MLAVLFLNRVLLSILLLLYGMVGACVHAMMGAWSLLACYCGAISIGTTVSVKVGHDGVVAALLFPPLLMDTNHTTRPISFQTSWYMYGTGGGFHKGWFGNRYCAFSRR